MKAATDIFILLEKAWRDPDLGQADMDRLARIVAAHREAGGTVARGLRAAGHNHLAHDIEEMLAHFSGPERGA